MSDLVVSVLVLFLGPLVVAGWIPNLVHEAGHYVAARALGARFDYVPLTLWVGAWSDGELRIRFAPRRVSCDAVLPSAGKARRQLLIATAAGPALSITIGLGLMWLGLSETIARTHLFLPLAMLISGAYVAAIGLVTAIPWWFRGSRTDGRRLLQLIRDDAWGRRWVAIRALVAQAEAGTRPRDWDATTLSRLVQGSDHSVDDVNGALHLYWHLLDSGRQSEARVCIAQAHAAAEQRYQHELSARIVLLEVAYMNAREGQEARRAAGQLLDAAAVAPAQHLRVQAAVLLGLSDFAEAEAAATAGLTDLRGLRPGHRMLERDLLTELRDEARRKRSLDPDEVASATETATAANGAATPSPEPLDVSRFSVPDLVPTRRGPIRVFSVFTFTGLTGAFTLALATYKLLALFVSEMSGPLAVFAGALGLFVTLWVRLGVGAMRGVRTVFAALAVFTAALPLLLGQALTLGRGRYIWFAGDSRPCLVLDPGPALDQAAMWPWAICVGLAAVLLGTYRPDVPLFPRRGLFFGFFTVALWIVAIAPEPGRLGSLFGCR